MGSVQEDPDELGYWKEPLGRQDAPDDLGDTPGAPEPPEAPAAPVRGYTEKYLYDIMPGIEKMSIVRAAQQARAAEVAESEMLAATLRAAAERARNAAGYQEDIDPCDP